MSKVGRTVATPQAELVLSALIPSKKEAISMYAIVESGGKQYRVEKGTKVKVETLAVEAGSEITLDRVFLVANDAEIKVGRPVVPGATVTAKVLVHDRAKKIIVFKKRSKKTYKKTQGHRQNYTELLIQTISA